MPSIKTQLDAKIAELKASLSPEQITLVLDLIQIFIVADRRGVLLGKADDEEAN